MSSKLQQQKLDHRAVTVAQLVEWSLPIPDVRGSNLVIGKIYIERLKMQVGRRRLGKRHQDKKFSKPFGK